MKTTSGIYATYDAAHAADAETPLHHGVIRYVPSDNLSATIRNNLPAKNDRPYVYVPVGYCRHHKDEFVQTILSALGLNLPNMVVVTAETTGSIDEQLAAYAVQNADSHPIANGWSEQHIREVLAAKVGRLLEGVIESSSGVGAWILPNSPRRRNAAAQMVCEAFPSNGNAAQVALGLIGLGEDEEDAPFKLSLDESKVPVGSPVRNVTQLVYDVGLMDGAPCAALTHLLLFESPEERNNFREVFLDLVPDYLVAFGNLTDDAMKGVFENAKGGSPVILLKHTGVQTDSLCKMFQHVNTHLAVSDDGKKSIPPMEGDPGSDLVKLFLNTWPASYNSKSIVLADPLIMNTPTLQKRILAAITSAFDLKCGDVDTRLAKRKVLDYAWSLHAICDRHSSRKKFSAEALHKQLVFFTLISIVASVLYERIYGGGEGAMTHIQRFIYISTIILPLYITSLKQESNDGEDMMNWSAFKVAATKIESEIVKFRCQVGPYRVHDKTQVALRRPVQVFATKIKTILNLVSKSNLVEDALVIPSSFWEFDVQAHMPSPKLSDAGGSAVQVPVPMTIRLVESDGIEFDSEPVQESTPLLEMMDKYSATKPTEGYDEEMPMKNDIIEADDASIDSSAQFIDDKYSPVKTDDYIVSRMQVKMHKKAGLTQMMARRNKTINSLAKIVTISSGATAALSLQWAVPIVLGITAYIGTGQEFRAYPRRIQLGNAMVMQLNELKLWWMSLSMYQKQLPHNKDKLVLSAEKIILTEMESSFAVRESSGDDEDE